MDLSMQDIFIQKGQLSFCVFLPCSLLIKSNLHRCKFFTRHFILCLFRFLLLSALFSYKYPVPSKAQKLTKQLLQILKYSHLTFWERGDSNPWSLSEPFHLSLTSKDFSKALSPRVHLPNPKTAVCSCGILVDRVESGLRGPGFNSSSNQTFFKKSSRSKISLMSVH